VADYLKPIVWVCLGTQLYHYFGYPLLLWIVARLRPRPPRKAPITPSVSLIVAAYNEEEVIAAKIENSLALDYRPVEIIVACEGSTDRTLEIAARFKPHGILVVHGPTRRGKALALNGAVQRATGEILVFTDANSFLQVEALRRLVRVFADPTVGCVGGSKTVGGAGRGSSCTGPQF
jgi:biofilm PGA synthesis N-glycosyltransferase PgaC